MKTLLLFNLMMLLLFTNMLSAEPWKFTTEASLSFNQSYYSDNWAGDELGSITWAANSISIAEKQLSVLFHNRTSLELAYGQTHQQSIDDNGKKRWGRPEKSTDKIDLESLFRMTFQGYIDPFFSIRWQSQFIDSKFDDETYIINPNRFTESAGIMRSFITEENHSLSTRLGAAFRQKIDRNVFVEDSRETQTTYDGGVEFIAEYMKRFLPQDILYKSTLEVYQALFNSEEDDLETDDWKAVDVIWEHRITTKIWSVINAVFLFEMIYEKEQDSSIQYRQTLGLGIFFQLY